MVVLDANILLYAHMPVFPQHKAVAIWVEDALSNAVNSLGVTWAVATAFLRVSTNRRVFEKPFQISFAKTCLDDLFAHPLVSLVGPTERHWHVYSTILMAQNLSGDIVMDAHIAAIALEHDASVASCDRDFRRFSDYVNIINPLLVK